MRTVAGERELAHVRDVEDPGVVANRAVLVRDRRVLDGHLPAGEGDEARAEGGVALEQRCASERLHQAAGNPSALAMACVARRARDLDARG